MVIRRDPVPRTCPPRLDQLNARICVETDPPKARFDGAPCDVPAVTPSTRATSTTCRGRFTRVRITILRPRFHTRSPSNICRPSWPIQIPPDAGARQRLHILHQSLGRDRVPLSRPTPARSAAGWNFLFEVNDQVMPECRRTGVQMHKPFFLPPGSLRCPTRTPACDRTNVLAKKSLRGRRTCK